MTYTETENPATGTARRFSPEHSRESHLQALWALRQSIQSQADGAIIACGCKSGRLIAKALRRQVAALDFAIDELDTEGVVRQEPPADLVAAE